jgi:hypothetical protein
LQDYVIAANDKDKEMKKERANKLAILTENLKLKEQKYQEI